MKATASSTTWPAATKPGAAEVESGEAGFTLLEVMVALAIVAIALVALLGLSSRTLTVNDRVQHITRATLLAQQRLAEIEAEVPRRQEDQELQGGFPAPFDAYRWRVSYQDTPLPSIRQITVVVAWGDEAKNEAVEFSSFLLRPGTGL